jgi:CHAT domain-containing protein/predicted negative regulator of RcsB-dependent stress response
MASLAAAAPQTVAPVPAGPSYLEQGAPQEGEIAAGETREHRVRMAAGDYARVRVDQTGVDVAVRLLDPAGRPVSDVDGPGGRKAPEQLSWLAEAGGEYRLVVSPHAPQEAGPYRTTLEELRPAKPGDVERVRAEQLFSEGAHWEARGDAESKGKALARYGEALALWQAAGDRLGETKTLNRIGGLHWELGESAEALSSCERALALAQEVGDRQGEAEAHKNLGVARLGSGQSQRALQDAQAAVRIWEELGDADGIAAGSYNLGAAQIALGQMDEALASLNRALEIRRAARNPDLVPLILTGIASIHRERGDGDKALEIYRQALEESRATEDRFGEANVLLNMASIYLRRGELQRALEQFNAALDLLRLLGNRDLEGSTLFNLGTTALYLGDVDQAADFYDQALALLRELKNTTWEAYTLCMIGWIHDRREDPEGALEQYTRAYDISQAAGERRSLAMALYGMGRSQTALGHPREAVHLLEQAIALFRETDNTLQEVNAVLELGRAFQALSDTRRAAEDFYHAVAISREHKTLMTEAVAQSAVARLERDRGNLPAAAAAIEDALRIIESIRPKVAAQRQRVTFFSSRREYYDFYVDLQMRLHERDPAGGHLEEALAASERARARGLLDLLAEGRIDLRRGISPELKSREEEIGNRVSLLQGQLLDDLSQGGKKASRFEAELDRAEEESERIEWQIQREHPHYAAVRNPAPLRPERIQELLDERTAFLEYAVGKEGSFLFVVTRDGLQGYRLPAADELAGHVEAVRAALERGGRRQYGRYVEAAHRLYEILLAPAAGSLRDKPRLIVSPDGPLLLLNFEALLTGPAPAAGGRPYGDLPYLLREKSVTYAPSASVFAELGEPADGNVAAASGTGLFLGFADPAYGPAAANPEPPAASSPLARALQEAGLPSPRRLPESRNEVLGIAGLYPKEQVHLYLDDQATEKNVKDNPALKDARWIHFAVHGFLNEARPELSGLVLAPDRALGGLGLLQVYEIFNLDLTADLVVLSACDTGLGKNVSGEGLLGVSRAFLYAGAASVVVSLWQVADASTSDLMVRFYRHLSQGADKAEALRLSKLELIREGRYDHPYYWAPFILIGRPGPVVTSRRVARQ